MAQDVEVAGDRPATNPTDDEIEITPEMIEAGVEEFVHFNHKFDSEEDTVIAIYKAMRRCIGPNPNKATNSI